MEYQETEHFKAFQKRIAEKYNGLDVSKPTTLGVEMPDRLPMDAKVNEIVMSFRNHYPGLTAEVPMADWLNVATFGMETENALVVLLSCVSDCLFHYELDNNFEDGDMRMAYLTMKRSAEKIGDVKPFLATIGKNRNARDWAMITLIWCFVLERNDRYWDDILNPAEMFGEKTELMKSMEKMIVFRNEFKRLHNAEKIAGIAIIYSKNSWLIRLFADKKNWSA